MLYKLTTTKSSIFMVLFYGMMVFLINISDSGASKFWMIFLVIFSVISFFIKTEFIINLDNLDYKIKIFRFIVFHKNLSPDKINKINFKRYGWVTKGAVIKSHKGISIRIVHFIPEDVLLQLETYAINNNVTISKSKDYLLLERREKYR